MSALSERAVDAVSWNFQAEMVRLQVMRGDGVAVDQSLDDARIESIFATAKADFQKAGATMQKLMNLFLLFVGVAIIIALSGVILAAALRAMVAGVAISTTGIAGMLALFARIHRYGRDQALFQFEISKYEMALKLSFRPMSIAFRTR
jgi:hypothetical protein